MFGGNYQDNIDGQIESKNQINYQKKNNIQYQSLEQQDYQSYDIYSPCQLFQRSLYPQDFTKVNLFCPVCGKFVQKNCQFVSYTSKNHRKIFLAHYLCLNKQAYIPMNGIFDEIQQAQIESRQFQKIKKVMMSLGGRQFYVQMTISHPLSDFKFSKLVNKAPLIGSKIHWQLYHEDQDSVTNQANIICIPYNDFKLTIFLSQIGVSDNKKKIQIYIDLSKGRQKLSKGYIAISQDISLQLRIIQDAQSKRQIIDKMNFKYQHTKLQLPMIQLTSIDIRLPQQFQQEQDQFQSNSNIVQLLDDKKSNPVQSFPTTPSAHIYLNDLGSPIFTQNPSQKSFQSQQKLDLQKLIVTNQLKTYILTNSGSRAIQTYLKQTNKLQVDLIIANLYNDLPELIMDVNGNYMMQKLFSLCNLTQRLTIMKKLHKDVSQIVRNRQGTHTIQAFISLFIADQQYEAMCLAIRQQYFELSFHQHATHFLQKLIIKFPLQISEQFYHSTNKRFLEFATDKNGMCVLKQQIKKINQLENQEKASHLTNQLKKQIILSTTLNTDAIIQDGYGNYIVQFCYQIFGEYKCLGITEMILDRFGPFSMQKFSSNVVLKCVSTHWTDSKTIQKLRSKLSNESILEMYNNKDANKILLEIMEKYQNTLIRQKIFNVLLQAGSTKYNHDRWGLALGYRSGPVGTQFSNFTEATKNPQHMNHSSVKSSKKKYNK